MEDDASRHGIGGNKPPLAEALQDANKALLDEIEPIAQRANALAAKVKDGIGDDATLGEVAELVTDAKALFRRIETRREEEKKPFLEAGRTVDGFFAAFKDRLTKIDDAFTDAASRYQRAKAAQAQAEAAAEAERLRREEEALRADAEKAKRAATAERKQEQADELAAQAEAAEARAATSKTDLARIKTDTGVKAGAKTVWGFRIVDYEAIPLDKLRPFIEREAIEKALRTFVKINKGSASLPGVHFEQDVKASFRK